MADSGGHWLNLAEVHKLTQSELLPGVIDESPKRGGLLTEFPLRQSKGIDMQWNRSDARRSANRVAIGSELVWSDNITYETVSAALKIFYDQTPLNKFVRDVYDTHNNYEAQQFLELRTGIVETLEDALIYDDVDFDALHIPGLNHWAVDNTGTEGDIDEGGGALALINVRTALDFQKHGTDFMLMSYILNRFISQLYQEGSIGDGNTAALGQFLWQPSEVGMPMPWWGGTPVIRSDYMLAEQENTGQGSDARAKQTTGTDMYSILFIKRGTDGMQNDPGIKLGFGGDTHQNGEFFRPTRFDTLEDFDAAGIRLTSYITLMCGSKLGIARIQDITAVLPTS